MKKTIKKITAVSLAVLIASLTPMTVEANDARSYTYQYDYWGDVQDSPDLYTVCKVFTASDLDLEKNFTSPQGLTVSGNHIYICDTGNNRIVDLIRDSAEKLVVNEIHEDFKGKVDITTFSSPTDLVISEDGNIFIADKGNARILKLDENWNYLMEFSKPIDSTIDEQLTFQPSKLSVDTAERVYCVASGINKGLIKYEADGTFSGFVGATPVTFNLWDYIWKKIASQEQRDKMDSFVPTEYDNLYMDYEGFTYVVTGAVEEADLKNLETDAVRKLNLLGDDILVRNAEWSNYGDLYMGEGGGYSGPSYFADVTCFDNDIYVCLDRNRGRMFGYDDQGNLVFAMGGNGNMDGYFRRPVALDHYNYDLYVLDTLDCAITCFVPTEFGSLVYDAIDLFDQGKYDESGEAWRQVKDLDGNYDLAYIGIGRSLLRTKNYKEAMEYFEVKYDDENYSKAYKQYRKEWVEENIAPIVIVILLLFLVPLSIGKVKSIKHEIEIADIFVINKKDGE